MDNIVDYLVAGFFIISFLTSIFKKKKKTAETDSGKKTPNRETQQRQFVEKKKTNNPFESFVNSINEELTKAKSEASRSEVDEYYEKAMLNSGEDNVIDKNIYQQRDYIEPVHVKKSQQIKSYSDSLKQSQEKHESKKAKDIRKRLLQGNSIKDFIVITEILGKPKALQK
ncbi:MAG: hypothetical protein PF445_06185 [Melioribacteraceae bacterium]|jgi:excinuclease UvrABC ATPase subunit|nr:hypothetical protein [Melioribacteraceae bacterium]